MKLALTQKYVGLIFCLSISLLLPHTTSAQPADKSVEIALRAMHNKDWNVAIQTLSQQPAHTSKALTHYLIAVCNSNLGNPESTLAQAIEALSANPPLDVAYAKAAKELIRWAGVEIARPKYRLKLEMDVDDSNSSEDLMSKAAIKEKSKEQDQEFARLKEKAMPYVDLEIEIVKAKLADPCWNGSKYLNSMIEELQPDSAALPDYRAPNIPIPELTQTGSRTKKMNR